MAAATILFGNLAALKQHNVKRLIGLSGVSHAGFILLAVIAAVHSASAGTAVYFYLFAYLIASFAVFGVMTVLAGPDDTNQELGDYSGLAKESPFLAGVLACGLGSLAGIPPFAGFLGKLFVFVAAFRAGHLGLLAVAIAGRGHLDLLLFRVDPGGVFQRRASAFAGDAGADQRRHPASCCGWHWPSWRRPRLSWASTRARSGASSPGQ